MNKLLKKQPASLQSQNGATMIEIMISILIFSIGLLGIASTQTLGLTNTQSALNRSYATQLSYEIIDIMRINRVETGTTGGIFDALNTVTTTYAETPGCDAAGTTCTATQLANHQVAIWAARLGTVLPNGQASITYSATADTYQLVMTWVDFKNTDETLNRTTNQNVAGDPASNDVYRFQMSFQI